MSRRATEFPDTDDLPTDLELLRGRAIRAINDHTSWSERGGDVSYGQGWARDASPLRVGLLHDLSRDTATLNALRVLTAA